MDKKGLKIRHRKNPNREFNFSFRFLAGA